MNVAYIGCFIENAFGYEGGLEDSGLQWVFILMVVLLVHRGYLRCHDRKYEEREREKEGWTRSKSHLEHSSLLFDHKSTQSNSDRCVQTVR